MVGHKGSDGSLPIDRIERYGKIKGISGENNIYGYYKDPMDHIASMIIDDGVKSRVHRQNLFNEHFRHMSFFEATHKLFKRVMVFVYAENYVEAIDESKNLKVTLEVEEFLQEPVLFDEELDGLGLKLPGGSLRGSIGQNDIISDMILQSKSINS